MIELLKELILDFQSQDLETGVKRHLAYELVKGKAFVCIGVRRGGKSTLLFQIMDNLRSRGVRLENFVYVNFFDERLTEIRKGKLWLILDAYYSLFPEKKGTEEVHFFFDEIQETENWEPFIDRILRTEKSAVYISGSSARMLSKEIATQVRGRSLVWELFPFSFVEFADYMGVDYRRPTSKNRLLLRKCFDEYFRKGGFPEVRDVSENLRVKIHQEYYKAILHRDVIERYDVIHPQAVVHTGYRLTSSSASLYTINRLTEYLKSLGHKVSKGFVSECLEWFEDAFFLFSVKLYSPSVQRQHVNAKKIYCVDHGLIPSVVSRIQANRGHLLENMVFTHIRRLTEEIYYLRTRTGQEVDFVWLDRQRNRHLVQVALSVSDPGTKKREIAALKEAMEEVNLKEATLVTLDEEETIDREGKTVRVIPAWKYLLSLEG